MTEGETQTMSEGADARLAAAAAPRNDTAAVHSVVLQPNRRERFYAGGRRIDELRGHLGNASSGPKDWVGSTTTSFGDHSEGLSRLADGQVLRQVIESDPVGFLGAEILLVELQEPTDLSVLLEWRRFGVSSGVEHLQLGWERALAALDLSATRPERPLVRDCVATTLEGPATVLRCLPPAPEAEMGQW